MNQTRDEGAFNISNQLTSPAVLVTVLSVFLSSCLNVKIPTPPDLSDLIASYDEPTAEASSDVMALTATQVADQMDNIRQLGLRELLAPIIQKLQDALRKEDDRDPVIDIEDHGGARGVVRIATVCPGWSDGMPTSSIAGKVELTATMREGLFESVVWGPVERCQYVNEIQDDTIEVLLDADVSMDLDGLFSVSDDVEDRMITITVNGTASIEDTEIPVAADFRIRGDGSFEFRIVLNSDELYVVAVSGDGNDVEVRASNGIWLCDLEEQECQNEDTLQIFTW